ncbi:YolD-like family protein [Shimazuella sp. AN120528]|uniref:YolD-like family protein n=1 Tax=Shimazuella soli TaxID=1892854 RepID=UPI001F0EB764|nr:YolD-like family protein [Shimazuella soli]MCH5583491.1 YolD-like family protein [Shimazuella soli]
MGSTLNRQNLLFEGSRFVLPEHRKGLEEMRRKQMEYTPPELDEDQKNHINYILQEAVEAEKPVVVTFATKYSPEQFCGFIDEINAYSQVIQLSNGSHKKQILLDKLINVEWP